MKRAYTLKDLERKKFKVMNFNGKWFDGIGNPELTGSWIIWGSSGNGKTMFSLQLAAYLSGFGTVIYDSLEEGVSEGLRQKIKKVDFKGKVLFLDKEPIDELRERLSRKKSPNIIIIDSVQYSGLNMHSYKHLINGYRNKLFVWISHAEGKYPAGRTAKAIRYDANVKIWVNKFVAYPVSRYGGGEPIIIWDEKAEVIKE